VARRKKNINNYTT